MFLKITDDGQLPVDEEISDVISHQAVTTSSSASSSHVTNLFNRFARLSSTFSYLIPPFMILITVPLAYNNKKKIICII